jgi:Rad3-related DNA helicase
MVARDKACEHPDKACHGESCPLARGFYDRLPQARQRCVQIATWNREALREVALGAGICPYYLGQDLLRWADVVVGDYNHYFDLNAVLYSLTVNESWRVGVLVDEAHNMVSRTRQMYTGALSQRALARVRKDAPLTLKKPLDRLQRQWNALKRDQTAPYEVHESLPERFVPALQTLAADMAAFYADEPAYADAALQGQYFDVLYFLRLAELQGPHALCDLTLHGASAVSPADAVLCLRNVVPAPMLKDRWSAAQAVTLFSATLSPPGFLVDMLGLPADTAWVDVPSAFVPSQLDVRVARNISTRYPDRERSLPSLVRLMSQQFARAPGNYLAFFSSFDYMHMAANAMLAANPDVPLWLQSRGMSEADRDAFLGRFALQSQGIGFAVLGGAFGEGIDLPGARLIGAFIATLGMPQVNPVNEQIRQRMQACVGHGYDYTYLFPGIQKVVQAAGRVIRTPQDLGVVFLMDDRFARPDVLALLPAWWQVR